MSRFIAFRRENRPRHGQCARTPPNYYDRCAVHELVMKIFTTRRQIRSLNCREIELAANCARETTVRYDSTLDCTALPI